MQARAQRGNLQRLLAAWLAALLSVAPLARPFVPIEVAALPASSPEGLVAQDGAQSERPAAGVLPAQPLTPGILSRASLLETMLGLPPVKSSLVRPVADQPVSSLQATTAPGIDLRGVFQRSSVGTARTPTGPPA